MDKISSLIEYFKSLVDCLYHQYFSLKEKKDITDFIYEYMLDDNKDFSEFGKDYINCEEYDDLDKKDILEKIMYAVYFMTEFYLDEEEDLYENILLDDYTNTDIQNNLDELFKMEEFGLEIINNFLLYLEFSATRKKKMALKLVNNKDFTELFFDSDYIKMLLANDLSVDIPEVAILVDDIAEMYDSVNLDEVFDTKNYKSINDASNDIQTDYKDLEYVRKRLVISSLNNNVLKQSQEKMKHWFSIMLKSTYINIYRKKQNGIDELTVLDNNFFDLITKNENTFEELFYKFMHDEKFSAYLIGSFYFDNFNKDLVDYEDDERIYKENKIEEKIKKYCIY